METTQSIIDNTTTSWVTYVCTSAIWVTETEPNWEIVAYFAWPPIKSRFPIGASWKPSNMAEFKASDRATLTYFSI